MNPLGFLRVTAACTTVEVANPHKNREHIERAIARHADSDVVLFPELALSGYTCGELFTHRQLLNACVNELLGMVHAHRVQQLIVVGLPLVVEGQLMNVAATFCNGQLLGIVPKQHLPTYQEFYEGRWFQSGAAIDATHVTLGHGTAIPFGTDLLFRCGDATVGIELCEDLWVPIPPSSIQTIGGANVLLNLSASNETIGKASYRKRLVEMQSGRCLAAYAYSSAGPTESTTDLVFGGHCLIAENGSTLAESKRVGTGLSLLDDQGCYGTTSSVTADIDLGRLDRERRVTGTMHQSPRSIACEHHKPFRWIPFELRTANGRLLRYVDPHPFVPKQSIELDQRCNEIFEIQVAGLAKRITRLPPSIDLVIGVSGGLDSTLALIASVATCDALKWGRQRIVGFTMPGFGTTDQTLSNANRLMAALGIRSERIDIRENCFRVFESLGHKPFGMDLAGMDCVGLQKSLEMLEDHQRHDLVFENVQARMRTMLLMNRGFVLGTGDLSEGALGWSTYNADHMSMYNINCSVPKTLVRFLVEYVADHRVEPDVRELLLEIARTPISPELLPLRENKSVHQSTEATIGPYELHDFFLYHFVRTGASVDKIMLLAEHAHFDRPYTRDEIQACLETFIKRFFAAQFKRTCVPDGPKVGTVSLSPRGDWRMPSDADFQAWL